MAHYLIHHEGAWNVYSTIVDAPIFEEALTKEQLEEWYLEEYGRNGLTTIFPSRVERALSKGTSCQLSLDLRDCLKGNHAGLLDAELSFDDFIAKFLTLKTSKATHV
jgi:hypothetical protein